MSVSENLLIENGLDYDSYDQQSLVVSRTIKESYPQTNSYNALQTPTMVFDINAGTDFIDLSQSFLKLSISVTSDAAGSFSFVSAVGVDDGSVINLIRNLRIIHGKSGTELVNTQRSDIFNLYRLVYNTPENEMAVIRPILGMDDATLFNFGGAGTVALDFAIPLKHLHPFFDPKNGAWLPAQYASGLRLEMDINNLTTAGICATIAVANLTAVSISPTLHLQSITLMDSAMAKLNKKAAQNSLLWHYDRVFTSQSQSSGTNINIDVRKAVSFANNAFLVNIATATEASATVSSYTSAHRAGSWNWRLGSLYLPQKAIDSQVSGYLNALIAWNKMDGQTAITNAKYGTSHNILATTLNRDANLALASQAVSSSRNLEINVIYNAGVATNYYVFMTYTALAKATLESCRVDV